MKDIKILWKKTPPKNKNMAANNIKISQKMKGEGQLSICEQIRICYKHQKGALSNTSFQAHTKISF